MKNSDHTKATKLQKETVEKKHAGKHNCTKRETHLENLNNVLKNLIFLNSDLIVLQACLIPSFQNKRRLFEHRG